MTSVRNDTETTTTTVCAQCGASFTAVGRRRWCPDACLPPTRQDRHRPRMPAMPDPLPRHPTLRPGPGRYTVAAALLDRLLHRSVVIDITGDSYPLRDHHARTDNPRRALRPTTAPSQGTP